MKKTMILSVALLLGLGSVEADDVSIADIIVPQSGTAVVSISLNNPGSTYTAGQMALVLPEGVTAVLGTNGDPQVTKGERFASTNHSIGASHLESGTEQFTIFSINSSAIAGTDGTLFSVSVQTDESLAVGTVLSGRLTAIELTTTDGVRTLFNDKTFSITIGAPVDPWITLDEASATVPEAATDADVRVLRSIKANEWSTICLPFDMTEAQVKAAFGDDVQLAEFISYEVNDELTEITVEFEDADLTEGLSANYPYVIKTSQNITEFTAEGVTIDPDEENAVAEYAEGRGKNRHVYGTFIGTFHAQTTVPENCLFLSGSNFWYSTGLTQMKAFRAYFELEDVLAGVDAAGVKMYVSIDGVATDISEMENVECKMEGSVYDLSGHRMAKPRGKGVYVVGGRKVAVR